MNKVLSLLQMTNTIVDLAILAIIVLLCILNRVKLEYVIKELILTCSGKDSLFSQKKIVNWLAIFISSIITAAYLYKNIVGMPIASFMWLLSWWLLVSGYNVTQIQKEKFELPKDKPAADDDAGK